MVNIGGCVRVSGSGIGLLVRAPGVVVAADFAGVGYAARRATFAPAARYGMTGVGDCGKRSRGHLFVTRRR
jgi:hypothetical protein